MPARSTAPDARGQRYRSSLETWDDGGVVARAWGRTLDGLGTELSSAQAGERAKERPHRGSGSRDDVDGRKASHLEILVMFLVEKETRNCSKRNAENKTDDGGIKN
jgi:hypothetical protein